MNNEIERLRSALERVQNFPSHPGCHRGDKSSKASDPASWRDGWMSAVEAIKKTAIPLPKE